MSGKRSYIAAAFNARPFGMPIPLNWFGIAAFALLGALLNPGLWLVGAGLEGLYLWAVSRNERFRAIVDSESGQTSWHSRYSSLSAHLDDSAREQQIAIEQQSAEIVDLLSRTGATDSQMSDVRQMAWLHLKLLAARAAVQQVIAVAGREGEALNRSPGKRRRRERAVRREQRARAD